MISDNIEQTLSEWQRRLKPQDRHISVKVVPFRESENCWGNVRWNLDEKCADINSRSS